MNEVSVAILHPEAPPDAGPLTRTTSAARRTCAEAHRDGFRAAGATRVRIVTDASEGSSFGARLRGLLDDVGDGGMVVLGSGAIPLATRADRRAFVAVAGADRPGVLANNRYSADIVAIARARTALIDLPDLPTDNTLPRWLEEQAGVRVDDLRRRTRLGLDIDGPLDLILLGGRWPSGLSDQEMARVRAARDRIRAVIADPAAELVVAGRLSAANVAWLGTHTAARTRALIEERGLRTARPGQRPPASVLGAVLEHEGAGAVGAILGRLGDAAIVDTRVLLAHRRGVDEGGWPAAEDRYASDLLLHERIGDPWLRDLTRAATEASIPIMFGGHTLIGPALRRTLQPRTKRAPIHG